MHSNKKGQGEAKTSFCWLCFCSASIILANWKNLDKEFMNCTCTYINTLSLLLFFIVYQNELLTFGKNSYNDLLLNGFLYKTSWDIYHEFLAVWWVSELNYVNGYLKFPIESPNHWTLLNDLSEIIPSSYFLLWWWLVSIQSLCP